MASTHKLLFWALMALLCLTAQLVRAQEDEEQGEENSEPEEGDGEARDLNAEEATEEAAQKGAEDVFVTAILPNHRDKKLPAGSKIEALIGFENDNANGFNVEYVRGFLTSPQDSTYFAQNFSGQLYNTTVDAGVEASLLYEFRPDAQIDPRDWGLIVEVFYADADNVTYLQTAYNGTITVTDPESNFDAKSLFAFLAVAGSVGFVFYMASKMMKKSGGRRGTKATAAAAEAGSDEVAWDYVKDRHLAFLNKGGSPPVSPTSSPKKKKKN
eukprot:TRINITY_DN67640_c6_g2_i1.p1 TRINITY_DN67640_c6_g2~~TRINITY_DN67640_c6_g2_i1.p1  ORF type:complete len:270 (+),score=59.52 TRINITY_DN67640_c6_g2_i1:103-912(+)